MFYDDEKSEPSQEYKRTRFEMDKWNWYENKAKPLKRVIFERVDPILVGAVGRENLKTIEEVAVGVSNSG